MATSIDLAALANLVQAQVTAIADFKDQQILLYTTTDPTVVVSDANGNPVTVPSWYATIGDNKAAVDAMKAQVDANTAAIAAINTGDTTINNTISGIQTQQATNVSDIATLKGQMTTVQTNQSADESAIATLQSQVSTIQAGGSSTSSTITDLQNTVSGHTTQIGNLQTQQTTNVGAISALQTQQSTNTDAIAALQTQQTTNTNNIASNVTAIGAINDQIATLQTQQTTHDNAIATNTTNIATNTTTLQTLQTTVATNTDAISTIEGNVSTLQATQATNTTAIGNVQNDMSTLQTSQATLQTASTQNTTDIGDLRSTIATLPLPGAYNPPYVSNRFFTQVFMDVNGRLLGGISRRSGKLWLNNGGWLSDRIDLLEGAVQTDKLAYYNFYASGGPLEVPAPTTVNRANSPTNRYSHTLGSAVPKAVAGVPGDGSVLSAVSMGLRADSGDLELSDGTAVGASLKKIRDLLPPDSWANNADQVVLLQSVSYFPTGYGFNGLTGMSTKTKVSLVEADVASSTARVGAVPCLVNVTNRKILASGATTLSATNMLAADGETLAVGHINEYPLVGTLAGIEGTMDFDGVSVWTFTPTVALSQDVYIPDETPFLPSDYKNLLASIVVVILAPDAFSDLPLTKRNLQAIVDAMDGTREKRFLIVTPALDSGDDGSTANGIALTKLERWVGSTYPDNHIKLRAWLQNTYAGQGNADAGTYLSSGAIPATYYTGSVLGTTAIGLLDVAIGNFIYQKGW